MPGVEAVNEVSNQGGEGDAKEADEGEEADNEPVLHGVRPRA